MKSILVILSLLFTFSSRAQTTASQPIQIGEKLPPMTFRNLNGPDSLVHINWKNKLTILDFWNTRCSGTYGHILNLEAIKNHFGSQLRIILVSADDENTTRSFIEKNKQSFPDVPVVLVDSSLAKLVPVAKYPHVWIDGNASVRYVTLSWNLNEKTIRKVLEGQQPSLTKLNLSENWMTDQPLFTFDSGRYASSISYYSYISPCIEGLDLGYSVANTNGKQDHPNRITQNCSPPINLFRLAFSEFTKYDLRPRNTIIFEGVDTFEFIAPPNGSDNFDQWRQQHLFTYDLMLPEERSAELYSSMQQDICRFFNVQAKIEKRKINCFVLKEGKINYKKLSDSIAVSKKYLMDSFFNYRNVSAASFYRSIANLCLAHKIEKPLLNEIVYKGKLNIRIPEVVVRSLTITDLNKSLSPYGLKIVEQPRLVSVLVIRPLEKKRE